MMALNDIWGNLRQLRVLVSICVLQSLSDNDHINQTIFHIASVVDWNAVPQFLQFSPLHAYYSILGGPFHNKVMQSGKKGLLGLPREIHWLWFCTSRY